MTFRVRRKIQQAVLTTNIHFPRFVEINGNVIINYLDVEDVHMKSLKMKNQSILF